MWGTFFTAGKMLNTTTYHQIFTASSLLRTLPALLLLLWTPRILAAAGDAFRAIPFARRPQKAAALVEPPLTPISITRLRPTPWVTPRDQESPVQLVAQAGGKGMRSSSQPRGAGRAQQAGQRFPPH